MSGRSALAALLLPALLTAGCAAGLPAAAPTCDALEVLALQAQSVPGADAVVCLSELPDGWVVSEFGAGDRGTRFALDHAVGGHRAVVVDVAEGCVAADGSPRVDGPTADRTVEDIQERGPDGFVADRLVPLGGACARIHLALRTAEWAGVLEEVDRMLVELPRPELTERLREATDGRLDLGRVEG